MFESLEVRKLLSVQTPFHGTPAGVNQIIQAEDFDLGGEGVAYHDVDSGNRFGGYRSEGPDLESTTDVGAGFNVGFIKAGEWLEYTVAVPATGTYHIGFRVANIRGGGSFHLSDAATAQNLTGSVAVPNTGNWQTYTTVNRDVTLTQGTHVLRITFDTNASSGYTANFNWFSILSNSRKPYSTVPFNFSAGASLQAENYDFGGEGVAYHDSDAVSTGVIYRAGDAVDFLPISDPGGVFAVTDTKAGEWLEYTVNVPTPGKYKLGFRVSSTAAGATLHLEQGGVNLTGPIAIPNTGNVQNFTTVTKAVTLNAGVQTLRLVFDTNASDGSAGNVNAISIDSAPTQAPFPGPSPFVVAPGKKLELEFFDSGGEGVAYHDSEPQNLVPFFRGNEAVEITKTLDAGGGFNVDLVKAGEWLEYTVDVPTAGDYTLGFRVSNIRNGGSFHLSDADTGTNLTGSLAVPNTGDWQKYTTVTRKVTLTAGRHVLRLNFDTNSSVGWVGNFNWMSVS